MKNDKGPHIVVSGLILDKNNKLFLARFPKWENKWAIPGGKVKYGESLINALKREIKEETKIEVFEANLLRVSESICDPSFRDGVYHMILLDYVIRDFLGKPYLDKRELYEFKWIPIHKSLNLELTPPTRASINCLIKELEKNDR